MGHFVKSLGHRSTRVPGEKLPFLGRKVNKVSIFFWEIDDGEPPS